MSGQRLITAALLLLLGLLQAGLWLGDGGWPHAQRLQRQLTNQQSRNAAQKQANARHSAEVEDLKLGLEMVEERARFDLGMIRPDEVYVQYAAKP